MRPTFTVLIGSIGRPSLRQSLDSIARQQRLPGDQCLVAFDAFEQTPSDLAGRVALVESYGEGFAACVYDAGYHWLGVEQINYALRTLPITGSHVFTIGDDDVFRPGVFEELRTFAACDLLRPLLFRFCAPHARTPPFQRAILPETPVLEPGKTSGCCIALPRAFVRPMTTERIITHDFEWMRAGLALAPAPLWLDYVAVVARPHAGDVPDLGGHARVWAA